MSNLKLVQVADLAYLNFDPYKQFGAQLRRIGNVSSNQDRGLSLLGGEEHIPEVMDDQVVANDETTQGSNEVRDEQVIANDETTQGSNEVAEPNFINDMDYANKLGVRP